MGFSGPGFIIGSGPRVVKPIFDSSKSQLLVAEELTGADFV